MRLALNKIRNCDLSAGAREASNRALLCSQASRAVPGRSMSTSRSCGYSSACAACSHLTRRWRGSSTSRTRNTTNSSFSLRRWCAARGPEIRETGELGGLARAHTRRHSHRRGPPEDARATHRPREGRAVARHPRPARRDAPPAHHPEAPPVRSATERVPASEPCDQSAAGAHTGRGGSGVGHEFGGSACPHSAHAYS